MSKQYNIRWRESDLKELERAINNFNQKLYRTKKKNPESAVYLPDRAKKTDVVKSIKTRADFNRELKSLRNFSKRGAEKPVHIKGKKPITKWAKKEYKKKQRRENLLKQKEFEKLKDKNVLVGGRDTGVSRVKMGSIRENSLKPNERKPEEMTRHEFEKEFNRINKRLNANAQGERLKQMKANYLKGLTDSGILGLHPEIEDFINEIDEEKFLETSQIDETATFDFYNDPIELEERAKYISQAWFNALYDSIEF